MFLCLWWQRWRIFVVSFGSLWIVPFLWRVSCPTSCLSSYLYTPLPHPTPPQSSQCASPPSLSKCQALSFPHDWWWWYSVFVLLFPFTFVFFVCLIFMLFFFNLPSCFCFQLIKWKLLQKYVCLYDCCVCVLTIMNNPAAVMIWKDSSIVTIIISIFLQPKDWQPPTGHLSSLAISSLQTWGGWVAIWMWCEGSWALPQVLATLSDVLLLTEISNIALATVWWFLCTSVPGYITEGLWCFRITPLLSCLKRKRDETIL